MTLTQQSERLQCNIYSVISEWMELDLSRHCGQVDADYRHHRGARAEALQCICCQGELHQIKLDQILVLA